MSAEESFFARWSRRKRGAAPGAADQAQPEKAESGAASAAPAASLPPEEAQPAFDLARLPSIESIGAGSDIRPFLAPGVPAELTRAALRRAWSADPAIRDFIGLSENSWDFNAPGGVPGFGSVQPEDVRRLLAQVMGEGEAADSASPATARSLADQAAPPASEAVPAGTGAPGDQPTPDRDPPTENDGINIAMQQEFAERECSRPPPRRRHGGALPK